MDGPDTVQPERSLGDCEEAVGKRFQSQPPYQCMYVCMDVQVQQPVFVCTINIRVDGAV